MSEDSGNAGSTPDIEQWFAGFRGHGEAAEGRVRVDVNGTGDIEDVQLDPKAMRLPSEDLAAAFKEAFTSARSDVKQQLSESTPPFQAMPEDVRETLDDLQFIADRRLNQFTEMADDLATRIERML